MLDALHARRFIAVVMPIGVETDGEPYNINAELVAGQAGRNLRAEKLVLMTNTEGVLDSRDD